MQEMKDVLERKKQLLEQLESIDQEIGLINKDRTSILGEKLISLGFEGSNSFFSKKMN